MSGPFQFPVILVKLATPLLPPQTKFNFEQIGSNEYFFAHNIAGGSGGGGGRRKEISLVEVYERGGKSVISVSEKAQNE